MAEHSAALRHSVAAIVINWNGIGDTRRCLQSIFASTYEQKSVCVVDNGSDEDEAGVLEQEFPRLEVLRMPQNLGYAAACNAGISWASRRGHEYACLFNNDTTIAPDFFDVLVKRSRELGPNVILAPLILDPEGRIWSAGGTLRWPDVAGEHIGLGHLPDTRGDPGRIDWASGCSLFFPLTAAAKAGPLDERFFLYLEDVEWCLRARRRGIELWYVPDAVLRHEVTKTIRHFDPRIPRYYAYRNFYLVGFRHGPLHWRLWFAGHLGFTLAKIGLRSLVSRQYRSDSLYHARTRGILDFVTRRLGKAPYEHRILDSVSPELSRA